MTPEAQADLGKEFSVALIQDLRVGQVRGERSKTLAHGPVAVRLGAMAMNAVIEVRRFPLGDRRNSRGNRVLEVFGFGPAKNLNSSGDGNGSRGEQIELGC